MTTTTGTVEERRAALAAADDQIIAAVRARTALAAGTERDLPGEYATVHRYREALGKAGAELAAAVLRVGRLTSPVSPR
jgi:hypothetical protein